MSDTIVSALISAIGVIIAAVITTLHISIHRVEKKIEGLTNGTYPEAMAALAEIKRSKEILRHHGRNPRRSIDALISDPVELGHSSDGGTTGYPQ